MLVSLDTLQKSKLNPKSRTVKAAVQELADSIAAVGLLQPIGVGPADPKTKKRAILFGHRRVAAARALKWKEIEAIELAPEHSLSVTITENLQREDMDPMAETAMLQELMDGAPKQTLDQWGQLLGKSRKWVARRIRLRNLIPELRQLREPNEDGEPGRMADWPVRWLEALAVLPKAAQQKLAADLSWYPEDVQSLDDVRGVIAVEAGRIAEVPWGLDWGTKDKPSECAACPHNTANMDPAALDEVGRADDSRFDGGPFCLLAQCFQTKRAEYLQECREKAQAKHGNALQLVRESYGVRGSDPDVVKQARGRGDWEHTTKKNGGKPALVVEGRNAGKVVYVSTGCGSEREAAKSKRGPGRPSLSLAQRRKELARKREVKSLQLAADRLEAVEPDDPTAELPWPKMDPETVLRMIASNLANGTWPLDCGDDKQNALLERQAKKPASPTLEAVTEAVARHFFSLWRTQLTHADEWHPEDIALVQRFGVSVADVRAEAAEQHPEPKSWAREEQDKALGKKVAADVKASAKKTAAAQDRATAKAATHLARAAKSNLHKQAAPTTTAGKVEAAQARTARTRKKVQALKARAEKARKAVPGSTVSIVPASPSK